MLNLLFSSIPIVNELLSHLERRWDVFRKVLPKCAVDVDVKLLVCNIANKFYQAVRRL